MREILFRGKRIDNGEWVEGLLIKGEYLDCNIDSQSLGMFIPYYYIFAKNEKDWTSPYRKFLVKEKTVGQFTGKCDKNGKKIFEGDIVEYTDKICRVEECGVIKYEDTSFEIEFFTDEDNLSVPIPNKDYCDSTSVIIIGNIHDNSDLLEG